MPDTGVLRRADARRVAEHILENGLFGEWEARIRAYNEALDGIHGWLQGLPAFPDALADRWEFNRGALLVAEEIVAAIREER